MRCARIEKGRCGVCEEFLRHQIIGLSDADHIVTVNTDGNAEPHMLRSLNGDPIDLHHIGAIERLEPEIINQIIAFIVAHRIELIAVGLNDVIQCLRNEGRMFVVFV